MGAAKSVEPQRQRKTARSISERAVSDFAAAGMRAKKSRLGGRANDTLLQRIGAFGQSNRISGNGTTLLLAITPAQRVGLAGEKGDARRKA
ncbi:hypothetical protein BJG93_02885 [Paraburkholderia sprentiae WSM5005]|uniref:Uncharacterized protein n=1 Tax=Paraburkholderia sprentiae WSM5005 TaxID=754502 RepID=A0A1I9YDS0_9BURK|nr:hypothetical protein [Paraburkholderia sprentiae]APA84453.2 hypothetical protein BJG93_02885 [Paraburkholderia sprentiae WSM5005]